MSIEEIKTLAESYTRGALPVGDPCDRCDNATCGWPHPDDNCSEKDHWLALISDATKLALAVLEMEKELSYLASRGMKDPWAAERAALALERAGEV